MKKNQSHNNSRPNASYSFISLSFEIKVIFSFIACQIINLSKGSLCLILGSLKQVETSLSDIANVSILISFLVFLQE